jgi:HTH-type transcriptional regulator / antitoxin HipB
MSKKNNIKPLEQFVEEQYGEKGTKKRDKFEKGFETFKHSQAINLSKK